MRESHALREHSFIQNTEAQLDAFIEQGRSVLGNLVEQRGILKGTRKRLLDAANTVGLSREIIGFIDRMGVQDRIIFAGGAIFTLFAFCTLRTLTSRHDLPMVGIKCGSIYPRLQWYDFLLKRHNFRGRLARTRRCILALNLSTLLGQ